MNKLITIYNDFIYYYIKNTSCNIYNINKSITSIKSVYIDNNNGSMKFNGKFELFRTLQTKIEHDINI